MIIICCQKMDVFLDVHRYKSIEKMAYKKKLKDSYVASAVPQGTAQLQFAMGNIFCEHFARSLQYCICSFFTAICASCE